MDRLPPELLRMVCVRCDVETLRTIRLLNQSFCTYATPELYGEVYVGFLSSSFEKLNQISTSSLGRHVQSLVCLADILPAFKDVYEWAARVYSGRKARGEGSNPSEDDKNVAFNQYPLYFKEQAELLNTFADQTFLTVAISRLENLGRVAVYRTQGWKGGEPCHPFWNRLYKKIMYPPGFIDYRDYDEGEYGRLLQPVLLALSISRAKIQDLTIADMGGEQGMLHRLDFSIFKIMTPAFSHLRHIDISMELYVGEELDHDDVSNIAEEFGNWLRSASLLETMIVSFLEPGTYDTSQDLDEFPYSDYLESLDAVVWPRLRKMVLRNYHTTERSLLRLICNQPSLQHLELNRIDFRLFDSENSGGSWESIFRRLGETKGPHLRSIKISEIADQKYDCAIIKADDEQLIKTVSNYIRFGRGIPVFAAERPPQVDESDEEEVLSEIEDPNEENASPPRSPGYYLDVDHSHIQTIGRV